MKTHWGLFAFFFAGYAIGLLGPYGGWWPAFIGFAAMAACQWAAPKLKRS